MRPFSSGAVFSNSRDVTTNTNNVTPANTRPTHTEASSQNIRKTVYTTTILRRNTEISVPSVFVIALFFMSLPWYILSRTTSFHPDRLLKQR